MDYTAFFQQLSEEHDCRTDDYPEWGCICGERFYREDYLEEHLIASPTHSEA